jgi:hypothetical protein
MIFDAYPLSMQLEGVRSKTVWFGIMIMCPSGATCLLVDSRLNQATKHILNISGTLEILLENIMLK